MDDKTISGLFDLSTLHPMSDEEIDKLNKLYRQCDFKVEIRKPCEALPMVVEMSGKVTHLSDSDFIVEVDDFELAKQVLENNKQTLIIHINKGEQE